MTAVVALGAVACDNAIDENLGTTEGVSITVTIDEATRVALGDLEEGKGYKLSFEEGDQLFVFAGSGKEAEGYYFDYEKTAGADTYVFTCTADGVQAIVGSYMYIYYQGGRKGATDAFGNNADQTIKGAFIKGEGVIGGSTSISMKVAPLLKLKSAYPVTITASDWVFNGSKAVTTVATDEWVYISTHTARTVTITATIKGEPAVVKGSGKVTGEKELAMEYNKIYNLGELDVKPEEVADGDPAGIAISIDGDFADWANITKNVATVAEDAQYGDVTVLKAYTDKDNVYVYASVKSYDATYSHMSILLDLDNDPNTGGGHWFAGEFAEVYLANGYLRSNSGSVKTYTSESYSVWDSASSALVAGTANYTAKVALNGTNLEVEVAFPRTELNALIQSPNIGVCAYSLTAWSPSGILPAVGKTLVIPVHN